MEEDISKTTQLYILGSHLFHGDIRTNKLPVKNKSGAHKFFLSSESNIKSLILRNRSGINPRQGGMLCLLQTE